MKNDPKKQLLENAATLRITNRKVSPKRSVQLACELAPSLAKDAGLNSASAIEAFAENPDAASPQLEVTTATKIMNRAMAIQRGTPGLSLQTSVSMALREQPDSEPAKIMNRAQEIMQQIPNLSLATATRMAQNEITAN